MPEIPTGPQPEDKGQEDLFSPEQNAILYLKLQHLKEVPENIIASFLKKIDLYDDTIFAELLIATISNSLVQEMEQNGKLQTLIDDNKKLYNSYDNKKSIKRDIKSNVANILEIMLYENDNSTTNFDLTINLILTVKNTSSLGEQFKAYSDFKSGLSEDDKKTIVEIEEVYPWIFDAIVKSLVNRLKIEESDKIDENNEEKNIIARFLKKIANDITGENSAEVIEKFKTEFISDNLRRFDILDQIEERLRLKKEDEVKKDGDSVNNFGTNPESGLQNFPQGDFSYILELVVVDYKRDVTDFLWRIKSNPGYDYTQLYRGIEALSKKILKSLTLEQKQKIAEIEESNSGFFKLTFDWLLSKIVSESEN